MTTESQTQEAAAGGRYRGKDGHGSGSISLGPRDSLVGKLTYDGDLRVAGKLEGEVKVSGDVNVDDGATVNASLEGKDVSVRGTVNGNVTAKGKLTLTGGGSVHGDVKVARLTVEDGATLNGNISMGAAHGSAQGSSSS